MRKPKPHREAVARCSGGYSELSCTQLLSHPLPDTSMKTHSDDSGLSPLDSPSATGNFSVEVPDVMEQKQATLTELVHISAPQNL